MTLFRLVTTTPTDGALALNGELGPPAGYTDPAADLANAYRTLHEAVENEQRCLSALREAEATVARTTAKIQAAEPAKRAAEQAQERAAEATRKWAIAGASDSMSAEALAVLEAAEIAQREATRAQLQAKGAQAALPEITAAVEAACMAVTSAASNVKAARSEILVASVSPLIAELERMQQDYVPRYLKLAGLALFLNQRFGHAHFFREHVLSDGRVSRAAEALSVPLPDLFNNEVVLDHARHWQALAAQLAADPETTIEP